MKKAFVIIVSIIIFGCSSDETPVDNLPYFQFTEEDNQKLINPGEVGDILIFKNQDNAELKFEITKKIREKQLHNRGYFVVGSKKFFYYDEQRIEMQSTLFTIDPPLFISLKRWPAEFNDGFDGNPEILSENSEFTATIGLNPFDNGISRAYIDYSEPMENLDINGMTYIGVRKIEIEPNEYPNPNWQLPTLRYIYFDQNKGLIGFDDVDSNEWRLQN